MPTQTTLKQALLQRANIQRTSTFAYIIAVFVFFMSPETLISFALLQNNETFALAFTAVAMTIVGVTFIPSLSILNPVGGARFVLVKPHVVALVLKTLILVMIDVSHAPRPLWTWVVFVLFSVAALVVETLAIKDAQATQEQALRVRVLTRNRSLGEARDNYETASKYLVYGAGAATLFGLLNFLDLLSYVIWVLVFYVAFGIVSTLANTKVLKRSTMRFIAFWTLIMMIVSSGVRIVFRDVFAEFIVIGGLFAIVTFGPLLGVMLYAHQRVIQHDDLSALVPIENTAFHKKEEKA